METCAGGKGSRTQGQAGCGGERRYGGSPFPASWSGDCRTHQPEVAHFFPWYLKCLWDIQTHISRDRLATWSVARGVIGLKFWESTW